VVTGFEFALHPIGPEVMFSAPIYPIEAGPLTDLLEEAVVLAGRRRQLLVLVAGPLLEVGEHAQAHAAWCD
jgi:hypothetical protein